MDSSFSGKRSCAHNMQEVGSQTPGRVVVRLSKCSNICSFVTSISVERTRNLNTKLIKLELTCKQNLRSFNAFIFKGSISIRRKPNVHAKLRKKKILFIYTTTNSDERIVQNRSEIILIIFNLWLEFQKSNFVIIYEN